MRDFAQTGNGLNCAYFVVGKRDRGTEFGPVAKRLSKRRLVDHTAIGYVRDYATSNPSPASARALFSTAGCSNAEVTKRPLRPFAFACARMLPFMARFIRFSTTRREIDFMRRGANERCDFLASPLNRSAGLASLRIERRGIAERTAQKRLHGLKCRIGYARSSGVVQIRAVFRFSLFSPASP